jgi:sugar phosphate isomerase/epimerase
MHTAESWPIVAATLSLGDANPRGAEIPEERWRADLAEVRAAGFDGVDLTDSWIRFGELDAPQLSALGSALTDAGLAPRAMSAIRRSVIDEVDGERYLAYAHRCIDAAAELGAGVVSVGLHRALTPEQQQRLWFWTLDGHRDALDDPDVWRLAVARLRELGAHAREVGLLLSLEMYEDTLLGSARSSVRLVEDIGSDAVGLNPDIGNLIRLPRPVEHWRDLLEATLPYANFWHVKNYLRYEDPTAGLYAAVPSYLEAGIIDYRAAMRIAVRSGFQGVICVEHYGGDGLSMSAAARDYLRRVMPRAVAEPLGDSRVRQPAAEAVR